MAEYIKREAVLRDWPLCDEPADAYQFIRGFPAADVRPVVRGKWIKPTRVPDSMLDECSVCGFDTGAYTFNFCPNCGADMREPPKEET